MKFPTHLLAPLAALAIASCTNDDGPVAAQPPEPTGTIAGFVTLIDSTGPVVPSGATVRIEGTSHSATTDSLGRWTIDSVPAGIYTFVVTKEGYSTERIFRRQFVGRDTLLVFSDHSLVPAPAVLRRLPGFVIESIELTIDEEQFVVRGRTSSRSSYGGVTVFFGTSASVSSAPGSYRYMLNPGLQEDGTFSTAISTRNLPYFGFSSGAELNVVAYPGGGRQVDPLTNELFWLDLVDRPSGVVRLRVP